MKKVFPFTFIPPWLVAWIFADLVTGVQGHLPVLCTCYCGSRGLEVAGVLWVRIVPGAPGGNVSLTPRVD